MTAEHALLPNINALNVAYHHLVPNTPTQPNQGAKTRDLYTDEGLHNFAQYTGVIDR